MLRQIFILISLCLFSWSIHAQSYVTSAGIRMGTEFGISVQQRLIDKLTLQGILSSSIREQENTFTVLLQTHQPLISKRFNFYLGGGFHTQWQEAAEISPANRQGITAIAGAEMTLGRLNLSWDFKPQYHLFTSDDPLRFQSETAITLRYVFIKKIKKKGNGKLFHASSKKKKQRARKRKRKAREKAKRVRMREK